MKQLLIVYVVSIGSQDNIRILGEGGYKWNKI